MGTLIPLVQAVCALAAAMVLGNWYLTEYRKLKALAKPWYAIYLSAPGIIIIGLIFLLPLVALLK